jgi:hypothetical protein
MNRVSWFGTVASIIGAFLVAFGILAAGYISFILGSVSWATVGIHKRDYSLITLNGFFLTANLIGLYNAVS